MFKRCKKNFSGVIVKFAATLCLAIFTSATYAADINVLIVGTTKDKASTLNSYGNLGTHDSKPFDITKVQTELQNILNGAGLGTANVQFHDFSTNSIYGNSLIAEFYDISTLKAPISRDFWANLRGETTDWDYVILMDEPHNIERYPGLYTLGVAECGKEIAKGNAETILFMGWPGSGSSSTVNHYKEVVYRTGRTLGYKVAPAGLIWQEQGAVHGTGHPSNNSSYLAAASLFSCIWGKSASTSTYANSKDQLADDIHTSVGVNTGKVQYSGLYEQPTKAFTFTNEISRNYSHGGPASSTENGLRSMSAQIAFSSGIDSTVGDGTVPKTAGVYLNRSLLVNENFSTNTRFQHPGNKEYDSDDYIRGVNLSYPTYPQYYSLPGVIDDLSFSINQNPYTDPKIRHTPCQLLWAQFNKEFPDEPLIESSHGGRQWKRVIGAYVFTTHTGRCPIGPEPIPGTLAHKDYVSAKIGYETAWRLGKLQGRAPGYRVMPSDPLRQAVDPETPEKMTVQFVLPSQSNVTVHISTDKAWANVSPQTLTFNAGDTNTVKEVTVSVSSQAANHRGEFFNVTYTTVSNDEVYDALSQTWTYGVNSLSVPQNQNVEVIQDGTIDITLTTTDNDLKQKHTYQILRGPVNGTVQVVNGIATYVPDTGFFGIDSFEFLSNDGLVTSPENTKGTIYIIVYPNKAYAVNLLYNPSAELSPLGSNAWIGTLESVPSPANAPALTGNRVFQIPSQLQTAQSYQDVKLDSYLNHINANLQSFQLSAHIDDAAKDNIRLRLEFLNANGQIVGTPYESVSPNSSNWSLISKTIKAPVGAVLARVILKGARASGSQTQGWFEDISLVAIKPNNSAPVATDTPVRSIPLDTPKSVILTVTDIDDDHLTYTVVQGPQFGTITGYDADGMPIYSPNNGFLGADSFTYLANDGVLNSNIATAYIDVVPNKAPVVKITNPTKNIIYVTLTNGIIVEGTVTDDGAPLTGELTHWWQGSGNSDGVKIPVTFGDTNALTTTANWGDFKPGKYSIQLYARDGSGLNATRASFTLWVIGTPYEHPTDPDGNVAPQIDVGGPYTGVVTNQALTLEGENFFDDGRPTVPGVTTYEWLFISGPGNAVFSDSSSLTSKVTFDTPGDYVLRLTGDDGQIKVYEDVTISVALGDSGENTAPSVDAGVDQKLTLNLVSPSNYSVTANLNATVNDPDGTTPTTSWSLVSGPGTVVFGAASVVDTTARFSVAGTYTLRLTANDGIDTAFDDLIIEVQGPVGSFSDWINAYNIDVNLRGFGDDPDGDGVSNALENYFGTDPGKSTPGVASGKLEPTNNTYTFSHPYNANHASDLVAAYRWSTDLGAFHANGASSGSATVEFVPSTPVDGSVTVTATISGVIPKKMFVDIEIRQQP